jgi:hypothetical protein
MGHDVMTWLFVCGYSSPRQGKGKGQTLQCFEKPMSSNKRLHTTDKGGKGHKSTCAFRPHCVPWVGGEEEKRKRKFETVLPKLQRGVQAVKCCCACG